MDSYSPSPSPSPSPSSSSSSSSPRLSLPPFPFSFPLPLPFPPSSLLSQWTFSPSPQIIFPYDFRRDFPEFLSQKNCYPLLQKYPFLNLQKTEDKDNEQKNQNPNPHPHPLNKEKRKKKTKNSPSPRSISHVRHSIDINDSESDDSNVSIWISFLEKIPFLSVDFPMDFHILDLSPSLITSLQTACRWGHIDFYATRRKGKSVHCLSARKTIFHCREIIEKHKENSQFPSHTQSNYALPSPFPFPLPFFRVFWSPSDHLYVDSNDIDKWGKKGNESSRGKETDCISITTSTMSASSHCILVCDSPSLSLSFPNYDSPSLCIPESYQKSRRMRDGPQFHITLLHHDELGEKYNTFLTQNGNSSDDQNNPNGRLNQSPPIDNENLPFSLDFKFYILEILKQFYENTNENSFLSQYPMEIQRPIIGNIGCEVEEGKNCHIEKVEQREGEGEREYQCPTHSISFHSPPPSLPCLCHSVFFRIVHWTFGNSFRLEHFALPIRDFHITMGFKSQDIHHVNKDETNKCDGNTKRSQKQRHIHFAECFHHTRRNNTEGKNKDGDDHDDDKDEDEEYGDSHSLVSHGFDVSPTKENSVYGNHKNQKENSKKKNPMKKNTKHKDTETEQRERERERETQRERKGKGNSPGQKQRDDDEADGFSLSFDFNLSSLSLE